MKETITRTVRPCVACGRPGYHVRKEIAPCFIPLCGPCVAWARTIEELRVCEDAPTLHNRDYFMDVMKVQVRILVRGAEREGVAHRVMMRNLAQFVRHFAQHPGQ